jgi:hypothetical protein
MKTFLQTLLLLAFSFVLIFTPAKAEFSANIRPTKGVKYSLTQQHISPKQFRKGYSAQKRDYQTMKETSFRKMMRKRHGSRFYRWIHKIF